MNGVYQFTTAPPAKKTAVLVKKRPKSTARVSIDTQDTMLTKV